MLGGCVGILVDSMAKSMATEETFSEMVSKFASLKDGSGRLYIYRTEASTKTSIAINIGLVKNPTLCTVNDTAYELIWEAFRCVNLPEGQHEITCGSDVLKNVDFWSGRRHYQRGANKIKISILSGVETYVRVDGIGEKPYFQPVLVENMQGREEIFELPYQTGAFAEPGGGGEISK